MTDVSLSQYDKILKQFDGSILDYQRTERQNPPNLEKSFVVLSLPKEIAKTLSKLVGETIEISYILKDPSTNQTIDYDYPISEKRLESDGKSLPSDVKNPFQYVLIKPNGQRGLAMNVASTLGMRGWYYYLVDDKDFLSLDDFNSNTNYRHKSGHYELTLLSNRGDFLVKNILDDVVHDLKKIGRQQRGSRSEDIWSSDEDTGIDSLHIPYMEEVKNVKQWQTADKYKSNPMSSAPKYVDPPSFDSPSSMSSLKALLIPALPPLSSQQGLSTSSNEPSFLSKLFSAKTNQNQNDMYIPEPPPLPLMNRNYEYPEPIKYKSNRKYKISSPRKYKRKSSSKKYKKKSSSKKYMRKSSTKKYKRKGSSKKYKRKSSSKSKAKRH